LYLLNPEEVEAKTNIWTIANADYLKEQKVKEDKEAHDKEMGLTKPDKKVGTIRRRGCFWLVLRIRCSDVPMTE
jgi:hypothetical protein